MQGQHSAPELVWQDGTPFPIDADFREYPDDGSGIYGRFLISQVRIRTEADGNVWAAQVLRRVCQDDCYRCSRCRQLCCTVRVGGFKSVCEVEDDDLTGMLLANLTCEHECDAVSATGLESK